MAEELSAAESPTPRRRGALFKRLPIIVTLVVALPAIWLLGFWFRSTPEARVTCDAQYNALLNQAKTDLVNGDRTAAINSLVAAKKKLRDCETPSAKAVAPMWSN
jgi:hypothetical protein